MLFRVCYLLNGCLSYFLFSLLWDSYRRRFIIYADEYCLYLTAPCMRCVLMCHAWLDHSFRGPCVGDRTEKSRSISKNRKLLTLGLARHKYIIRRTRCRNEGPRIGQRVLIPCDKP